MYQMTRPAHSLIFADNKSSREWRTVHYCFKKTEWSWGLRTGCWIKSTSSGKIRHFLVPEFIFLSHYLFVVCVCWAGQIIREGRTALRCTKKPSKAGLCCCLDVTPQELQNLGVLLDQLYPKWRTAYKFCKRGLEEMQGEGLWLICSITCIFPKHLLPFTARAGIVL